MEVFLKRDYMQVTGRFVFHSLCTSADTRRCFNVHSKVVCQGIDMELKITISNPKVLLVFFFCLEIV